MSFSCRKSAVWPRPCAAATTKRPAESHSHARNQGASAHVSPQSAGGDADRQASADDGAAAAWLPVPWHVQHVLRARVCHAAAQLRISAPWQPRLQQRRTAGV
jgi:hypothetical protein